jgi:hypothetical protein
MSRDAETASCLGSASDTGDALRAELGTLQPGSAGHLLVRCSHSSAEAECKKTPWWLWWNLLCMDAPAVAGLWALLFARASGLTMYSASIGVLVVLVWVIYTSDRVLDARKGANRASLKDRHLFCAAHRIPLRFLLLAGAAGSLWFSYQHLRREELEAGIILGAIVGLYLICVHTGRLGMLPQVPKEVAVGTLFAAGTTLPVWSNTYYLKWYAVLVWLLFAAVCALNCLAIECWENRRLGTYRVIEPQPFLAWIDPHLSRIAVFLIALSMMVFVSIPDRLYRGGALAICIASLLTVILNSARARLSCRLLRVLADAALVIAAMLGIAFRS